MSRDIGLAFVGFGAALWAALRSLGRKAKDSGPIIRASYDQPAEGKLEALFNYYGSVNGVSPHLLEALAVVESGKDPGAINPADPSYGLGQVQCVADEMHDICQNKLPAVPEFASMTPKRLLNPETNIRIYAQIIAWNIRRFPGDLGRAIVAYNNWSAAVEGRDEHGKFPRTSTYGLDPNEYLKRVMREYQRLKVAAGEWVGA